MLLVEPIDPTAAVSWLLQDGMVGEDRQNQKNHKTFDTGLPKHRHVRALHVRES